MNHACGAGRGAPSVLALQKASDPLGRRLVCASGPDGTSCRSARLSNTHPHPHTPTHTHTHTHPHPHTHTHTHTHIHPPNHTHTHVRVSSPDVLCGSTRLSNTPTHPHPPTPPHTHTHPSTQPHTHTHTHTHTTRTFVSNYKCTRPPRCGGRSVDCQTDPKIQRQGSPSPKSHTADQNFLWSREGDNVYIRARSPDSWISKPFWGVLFLGMNLPLFHLDQYTAEQLMHPINVPLCLLHGLSEAAPEFGFTGVRSPS